MWVIAEIRPWYVCYQPDGKMLMTLSPNQATAFKTKEDAIKTLSRSFKDPEQAAKELESGSVGCMEVREIKD